MALHLSVIGISGSVVTVRVQNTGPQAESLRVRVVVQLASGPEETLVSNPVTVGAGLSVDVQLAASGPVQVIIDDPEPF